MRAQIIITLNDDGSVSLTGPIEDQIMTFGLLEIARNVVTQVAATKLKEGGPSALLQVPPGMKLPPDAFAARLAKKNGQ